MHSSKQNVLSVPTKWQPWKQSNRAPCHGGFPFIWCWSHLLWSLCIPVTVSYLSPPTTPSCKLYAFHMVIIWDFPDFQSSLFFSPSQVLLIKKRTSSVVAFCVAVQKNKKIFSVFPLHPPNLFPLSSAPSISPFLFPVMRVSSTPSSKLPFFFQEQTVA